MKARFAWEQGFPASRVDMIRTCDLLVPNQDRTPIPKTENACCSEVAKNTRVQIRSKSIVSIACRGSYRGKRTQYFVHVTECRSLSTTVSQKEDNSCWLIYMENASWHRKSHSWGLRFQEWLNVWGELLLRGIKSGQCSKYHTSNCSHLNPSDDDALWQFLRFYTVSPCGLSRKPML